MPESIVDPVLNASVNNDVRPMCERARNLVITASALADAAGLLLGRLGQLPDDTIVDDGRYGEGVPPPTVGDLRAAAQFLEDVLPVMARHAAYPVICKLCVRLPNL